MAESDKKGSFGGGVDGAVEDARVMSGFLGEEAEIVRCMSSHSRMLFSNCFDAMYTVSCSRRNFSNFSLCRRLNSLSLNSSAKK